MVTLHWTIVSFKSFPDLTWASSSSSSSTSSSSSSIPPVRLPCTIFNCRETHFTIGEKYISSGCFQQIKPLWVPFLCCGSGKPQSQAGFRIQDIDLLGPRPGQPWQLGNLTSFPSVWHCCLTHHGQELCTLQKKSLMHCNNILCYNFTMCYQHADTVVYPNFSQGVCRMPRILEPQSNLITVRFQDASWLTRPVESSEKTHYCTN